MPRIPSSSPEPVAEQESGNNTQVLDPGSTDAERGLNFFTFFDPNIGSGVIDSSTPYVRITGSGDYSYDIYRFDVSTTQIGINPTTGSTTDTNPYHSKVEYALTGKVESGDVEARYRLSRFPCRCGWHPSAR